MPSPCNELTTCQIYDLIMKILKRLKYLEKVVEECCGGNPTSDSTGFRGKATTSNTGGWMSSINTSTSSGLGSMVTSGTGSNSVPDAGSGAGP